MKPVKFPNRMQVSFSHKELELIEQYAATRGIKKATAVKELAIRGLELTAKSTTYNELINKLFFLFNVSWLTPLTIERIKYYIANEQYLLILNLLTDIKKYTTKEEVRYILDQAIIIIKNYESNRNTNNYLNNRD